MWVQHHNGIFVSSDEGKTFSEISGVEPSTFGFPVAVHPRALDEAGDRLAFGSTTGGLWVSEDQGDRWACVTHTLPPIYSVRFA
jgi:hypothetical protein